MPAEALDLSGVFCMMREDRRRRRRSRSSPSRERSNSSDWYRRGSRYRRAHERGRRRRRRDERSDSSDESSGWTRSDRGSDLEDGEIGRRKTAGSYGSNLSTLLFSVMAGALCSSRGGAVGCTS
eukprot:GHVS01030561.1.p2 GENE.GHVS01030561.1~~GHVS01030561.1.p2  ORF type:complete len:124 (-),score=28.18 GHVS01030561.1:445-816(-)